MKVVHECGKIFIKPRKASHNIFLILILIITIIPLLKAYGEESIKYDGLYEKVGEPGKYQKKYQYIRFYEDGSVKMIFNDKTYSQSLPEFRKISARYMDRSSMTGKHSVHNLNIEFSLCSKPFRKHMSTDYKGTINGDELQLEIYNHYSDYRYTQTYRFISDIDIAKGTDLEADIAEKTPKKEKNDENLHSTKKVISKKIAKTVEPKDIGPWITVITHYDSFGHPVRSDLFNLKGELVARKGRIYSGPQLVQTFIAHPGPLKPGEICDIDSKEIFFGTDHDTRGNPKINRLLCLGEDGNIIIKNGTPLLIESFKAVQNGEFNNIYDGAWIDLKIWKYKTCSNCGQVSGNNKVRFIF